MFFANPFISRLAVGLFVTALGITNVAAESADSPLTLAKRGLLTPESAGVNSAMISELRTQGQPVIDELIELYEYVTWSGISDPRIDKHYIKRLKSLIDAVAAQRDAHASGLFWYTDLDAAIAEAQRAGRPILSLRLLGRLDTDLSCANSRFFRTVLYADTALRENLREDYVLHWQTVRPVPVITIDMGDGRTIERTITGNSAHYVLDAQGRAVDVLPGLYAPRTFERLLDEAGVMAVELSGLGADERIGALIAWHGAKAKRLDEQMIAWGVVDPVADDVEPEPLLSLAVGKSFVERPLVRHVAPQALRSIPEEFSDAQWQQLAAFYAEESRLDAGSRNLMRSKMPAEDVAKLARSKMIVEDPFMRALRNLQASIALDTARNEHDLHRRVHGWFAAGESLDDLAALNVRVYDELFLMPEDDPWLGLVPADTYAALDGGGLSE